MPHRIQEALPLELRQYLEILKRHKWFIVEAVVIVALVAGIASSLRTPSYKATARVLLHPNDPNEQLNPANGASNQVTDPDRYVAGQESIIQSEAVAGEAAKLLPPGTSIREIESRVSVTQGGQSDILKISATDPEPARARELANAIAKGYIENRRKAAVAGLQQAAGDIEQKLGPLLATIAQYDSQIGDGSTVAGVTNQVQNPAPPAAQGPAQPIPQSAPGLTAGGVATTQEALKAARYSAALQYETLFSRQQELLVDISLKRGEAEIVAEATTPGAPVSPHPKRDAALGGFVGLLIGVGVSFLREQLDDRVHSADEAERITGLAVLAQLPFDDGLIATTSIAAVDHPLGPLSESIRALRTSVQYASIDQPMKVVMVTSAAPGEGKSLVAANLAVVFAQADRHTVLISADLRRTTLNALFGNKGSSPGLTGVVAPLASDGSGASLNGEGDGAARRRTPALAALVKTDINNLMLLPSGPVPPNPAELMGSRRLAGVLAEYAAASDVVVIDTPPLLPVTDAAVLAGRVDGVVLVVAVNETRRDALRRAKSILEGTGVRVLGLVVNKTTRAGSGDYHAYYGGYPSVGDAPEPQRRSKFGLRSRRRATSPPSAADGASGPREGKGAERAARPAKTR